MGFQIGDGTGRGYTAEVTKDNHLSTHAFREDYKEFAARDGDAFNINTGTINLSNATATPVLYLENTGEFDMIIPQIIYLLRASTNGTGDVTVDIYKNITGGTIVSNATAVDMQESRNLSSPKQPSGKVYKGATGSTRTGGTQIISTLASVSTRVAIEIGNIVLPKGNNACIEITAPTSNTSMDTMSIFEMWSRKI